MKQKSQIKFERDKYLIIKKAIPVKLADFVYQYFLNKRAVAATMNKFNYPPSHVEDYFGGWNDSQVPQTYSHYSDIAMETLLQQVKPIMEEKTGLQLIETYSYARIYKKGDILHRHKDRSSCEISTTLNLGGPAWPIFLEPDATKGSFGSDKYIPGNTPGVKVVLNPGDMLIYRGCDLEHWREAYDDNGCTQVFLHYNNASSPNAELNRFDNRPHLGLPVGFKNI